MKQLGRSILGAALWLAFALPCAAGIHYKAVTKTEAAQSGEMQTEAWVAGDNAKVAFVESSGNPVLGEGTYLLTKDGGKTLLLVNPKDKTYAEWNLQGMLGTMGAVMVAARTGCPGCTACQTVLREPALPAHGRPPRPRRHPPA